MKKFILYGVSKSFLIKVILALTILLIGKDVFAADITINSQVRYPVSGTNGTYQGTEIYNSGTTSVYSIGTRYNGQLSRIRFFTNYNFEPDTIYTITLNMATEDWRNHFMGPIVRNANADGSLSSAAGSTDNMYVSGSLTFVSQKKIRFKIHTLDTLYTNIYFDIYSTNVSSTSFTGVSNWALSSIVVTEPSNSGGSSGGSSATPTPTPVGSTPTPTPTGATNQDIINNNNNNTNDIIENNNNNTNDIIENNNNNTESLIENQTCPVGPFILDSDTYGAGGFYLDNTGELHGSSSYKVSTYLVIKPHTNYRLLFNGPTNSSPSYCFYTNNKTNPISCYAYNGESDISFTSPSSAVYLRVSIRNDRSLTLYGPICNNFEVEGLKNLTDVVNASQGAITGAITGAISQANQNTEDLLENQTCPVGPLRVGRDDFGETENKYLDSIGTEISSNSYATSVYFKIKPDTDYTILTMSLISDRYLCFYDQQKIVISCNSFSALNMVLTSPSNAVYMRLSLRNDRYYVIKGPICNDWEKEGLSNINDSINSTNQKLDELNNNIMDDTAPDIDLDINTGSDTPISDLLLMPINLLNKINDNINRTCTPITIPFDFFGGNRTLTFPCINLKNYLGNDLYNLLDGLFCLFICYNIGMMCVTIWDDFTSLRDDFGGLYTPQHGPGAYRGKHSGNWGGDD